MTSIIVIQHLYFAHIKTFFSIFFSKKRYLLSYAYIVHCISFCGNLISNTLPLGGSACPNGVIFFNLICKFQIYAIAIFFQINLCARF